MQLKSLFTRFGIKSIEIAGAGLVSALCAYGLAQMKEPAPVAPAVVQVLPANDDAIRMVHEQHALLAQLVRRETENQNKSENTAAVPATDSMTKPLKPPQAGQARRNHKREQIAEPGRTAQPTITQPSRNAPNSAPQNLPAPIEASGTEERQLFARIGQWFFPDNNRLFGEAPRPPAAVGEFHSEM